jgi:hypothetical protein
LHVCRSFSEIIAETVSAFVVKRKGGVVKKVLLPLFILPAVMLIAVGCISTGEAGRMGKPGVVHHVVILWLKDRGNSNSCDRIIQSAKDLAKLPGVLEVKQGIVLPSDRPVVDSSYDVALVFSFRDKKALLDYGVNPEHKKISDEIIKPLVSKIQVYDFTEK